MDFNSYQLSSFADGLANVSADINNMVKPVEHYENNEVTEPIPKEYTTNDVLGFPPGARGDQPTTKTINQQLENSASTVDCGGGDAVIKAVTANCGGGDAVIKAVTAIDTRQILHDRTQEIVEEVNQKRHRDSQMVEDYKRDQMKQVENMCTRIENRLFEVYKKQNKEMQEKIHLIFETFERIEGLESELQEFRNMFDNLYKEIVRVQGQNKD